MPGSSDENRSDPIPAVATSTGLVHRRPGFVWLLAAVLVSALLAAALLVTRTGATEDDLRERSLAALQAQGINGVQVTMDGRDATVVVPAGADAQQAREVVARVDGIRVARATGGSVDVAATPSPSPTTGGQTEAVIAPFSLVRTDTSFEVTIAVRNQAIKDAIVTEVQSLLKDGGTFGDKITVDPDSGLANVTAVTGLLRALSTATGDASVDYDGTTVKLSGRVSDQATKATAARAAATAVPGAVVANQLTVPQLAKPPVSEACQTFEARLAQFTAQNKIIFLSGTAIVNDPSRPSVVKAAALLKSCATTRVEVAGYTDNLGSSASSLPLSQERADAVKATLTRLGVPAERLTSRGYGEADPVASNSTAAGRVANRRVELRIP
ncbi:OOP family OmpA-OmpF porin [Kribbella voronezhensis]|uniref:OOP family OmpA-OmpF porin n=1 Tax=Kribbella voronezhensis TaxID=2512212 RepID=A0A4R7SSU4_9ACTN|nr:OmpA family protein [Kribbella voronezhensis]TDU82332.1 OOP family OmpA-OmpF porin [Kribbella voronezhensis]